MYNFVFWFFYKYFEWKDKDDSTFIPSAVVILTFTFHLILLFSLFRYFTDININLIPWGKDLSYGQIKYLGMPFVILLFILVWRFYYRKKAKIILSKYEGKKPFTIKNIWLIIFIMVVPLIVAIRLTNMSL